MDVRKRLILAALAVAIITGIGIGLAVPSAQGQGTPMVYELRSYYANPGKAEDMHTRFREHTMALFEKHGMKNIGYWVPAEAKDGQADLVYIVAHASREQAAANWKAFSADPEWQAVYKASHVNGPLVNKVESVFLSPTDYSPLK